MLSQLFYRRFKSQIDSNWLLLCVISVSRIYRDQHVMRLSFGLCWFANWFEFGFRNLTGKHNPWKNIHINPWTFQPCARLSGFIKLTVSSWLNKSCSLIAQPIFQHMRGLNYLLHQFKSQLHTNYEQNIHSKKQPLNNPTIYWYTFFFHCVWQ